LQEMPELEPVEAVAIPAAVPLQVRPALELIAGGRDDWTHPRAGLLSAATWQLAVKRALDVIASAIALLLLLPVMLAIGAVVRLTSPGPALYIHDRIGRDGRPFRMYKFRSMHDGASLSREELLELNEATWPMFKIRRDPRLTRVGRWLRVASLDELPELINVLRGDMSLVGPRPPLPHEYKAFGPRERARFSVKPGLTCIWQVSGRSDETWVEMDLEYISTWNLRRDLRLLVQTIPAVISGRGAY